MVEIGQANGRLTREWVSKLRWYFGPGHTVCLRSSFGATIRRLEASVQVDGEMMKESAAAFQREIRAAVKAGRSRSSLPWEPLVTAAPTAERPPPPAVVEQQHIDQHWDWIAEVSIGLTRLKHVCPEGPAVLELAYGPSAKDWQEMAFPYGSLYVFDDRAIRLLASPRRLHEARVQRRREKAARRGMDFTPPDQPTDLELMVADRAAATAAQDEERLCEYAAIEAEAARLLAHVAGVWNLLHTEAA